MAFDAIVWVVYRLRPKEGWISFLLLVSAILLLVGAIGEVDWVPEAGIVGITAVIGLLLAYLLAKKARSTLFAWILLPF